MRKIFYLFIFLICATLYHSPACAHAESSYYAKIETSGTFLYQSKNDNTALFEIPASYFVKVEKIDDGYFVGSYNGIQGYIKKNQAVLMSGSPKQPYANANFKVFVSNYIYSNPTQTSSIVCPISTSDNPTYYGIKSGQQISSTTNIWYYCSIEKDNQKYCGYVFSGITDYLTQIQPNSETFERVDESSFSVQTPYSEVVKLSTKTKILLIVSISLPSVLILYFLIKPSRIQVKKIKKSPKQHKIRHGDYYEFDESDL